MICGNIAALPLPVCSGNQAVHLFCLFFCCVLSVCFFHCPILCTTGVLGGGGGCANRKDIKKRNRLIKGAGYVVGLNLETVEGVRVTVNITVTMYLQPKDSWECQLKRKKLPTPCPQQLTLQQSLQIFINAREHAFQASMFKTLAFTHTYLHV